MKSLEEIHKIKIHKKNQNKELSDNIKELLKKLEDKNIYVIVQTAPSIRVALGEEFGMPIGTNVTGKMVTALKKLGFDKIFDTNTGADFTIVEEANEFVKRLKENDNLPMMTSCCPAWVRFVEMNYPELIPHLSTCKSPHQMLGSIIKTYYAKIQNIDPKKIYTVSIMPCIAKKFERQRPEMKSNKLFDVDNVITTVELADLIKSYNINFQELEDSNFDNQLGISTGAGAIFGTTGGVMEAALRTAQDTLTGKDLEKIKFEAIRGEKGIKRASINIGGRNINVVVVNGLSNAKIILEEIKAGKADYQFVEVMACSGGCIMGSGQPLPKSPEFGIDVRKLRANVIYSIDEKSTIRKAHESPVIKKVYEEFFESPGSYRAEKFLHVKYYIKDKNKQM